MRVSVIIPALNEEKSIHITITSLLHQDPIPSEIIVVDGGSSDSTIQVARQFPVVQVLQTSSMISLQSNLGAEEATGDVLLFLHADCELETGAIAEMIERLKDVSIAGGAFRYAIRDRRNIFDWFLMLSGSWNARISGMYLGDHGIFCHKTIFDEIKGFPKIPIMYEFDFMKRLHKQGKVVQLKKRCYSSPRKFRQHGYFKILLLMRMLRVSEYFGLRASHLKNLYQVLSMKR